jgi:hypothetical protein
MDNVQFHIGEVIADAHLDTYIRSDYNQFEITVKTYTDFYDRQEVQAIPLNSNIKQIPLVGEHVLIVQGISAENNSQTIYPQWYYVSSFSLHSDINANLLKGVAPSNTPYVPKSSFQEKEVSVLQPFEGDVMIEGRFGNSIRLTSTVQGGSYSVQPSWSGKTNSDPIIILSNGKTNKKDSYIVEQIDLDKSSLYLTSTQQITNLVLNNKLHIGRSESAYNQSQFIGTADRIILTAKTDIVALDSQKGIELLAPRVKIGAGPYEPMLQSTATVDAIQKIIQVIQSGFVDSSGAISTPINQALASIDLSKLKSKTIEIDQWRNR